MEEPRRTCWAIVGGRGRVPGSRFTGIVENIVDHNLAVIGASGVRNRKFHKRSEALAWFEAQAEEARAQAGVQAEEAAYVAANAIELD